MPSISEIEKLVKEITLHYKKINEFYGDLNNAEYNRNLGLLNNLEKIAKKLVNENASIRAEIARFIKEGAKDKRLSLEILDKKKIERDISNARDSILKAEELRRAA